MAPETKFIHDYVNSKNASQIEEVLRNHGIVDPWRPCRTRFCQMEKLFPSTEALDYYKKDYPHGNPLVIEARKEEDLRLITLDDYDKLTLHAEKMRKVLGNMRDNGISLYIFQQKVFKMAVELNAIVSNPIPGDSWHFRIEMASPMPENVALEDLIEIRGILLPVHDPQSDVRFEYTKKCVVCGKYYQAKGQKAIYCSERCRAHVRNQMRKEEMNKD